MNGATADDLRRLAEPFAPADIEWRVQQAGEKNGRPWARVLAYVTNRAIMERFDDVVGAGQWKNRFRPGPSGGVACGLGVLCARAGASAPRAPEWVWKWDGAENTEVEGVKGGLSSAMKRAAVQWGIGRYLYDLEEGWAKVHEGGKHSSKAKDGSWFKWDPPDLPAWALPPARAAAAAPVRMASAEHLAEIGTAYQLLANPADRARVDARIKAGDLTAEQAAQLLGWIKKRLPPPGGA